MVPTKLKRKQCYKGHYICQYVRPAKVFATLQWLTMNQTTHCTRMCSSTVAGSVIIMNDGEHSTVHHCHHHYELPLAYTLDHSISMPMVKLNSYEMCVFDQYMHLLLLCFVSCTDNAILNSLARKKDFAVQDVPSLRWKLSPSSLVPEDQWSHDLKRKAFETESSHSA